MTQKKRTERRTRHDSERKSADVAGHRRIVSKEVRGYDRRQIVSVICRYHCKGYTVRQMCDALARVFPHVEFKREDFYEHIRYAAKRNWLHFRPPRHLRLADQIRDNYTYLKSVRVVHTAVLRDVAQHAARTLIGLLQTYRRKWNRDEVHIGFAGGHSMRALARAFADELCEPAKDLPRNVVFHALASGFDNTDPTTNPNAFFTYFMYKPMLQIKPHFLGLSAPAIVTPDLLRLLKKLPDIKAAYASAKSIDIVVTSGSQWSDEDSALRKRVQRSSQCMETLEKEQCVGDILWRPLSDRGPIEAETEYRALTLIELGQLPAIIRGDAHVLLMLGPCGNCHVPKGRLLRCVLEQKRPLITDLVVDSGSASQLTFPQMGGYEH